ncbi:MAG: YihY/virulence factor BrkB family protein [Noviherbaspirillum sp.]
MSFGKIFRLMKEAVSAWIADYAPSMGAALSYYTLFSIAPLLLIVVSVAGLVFGEEAARGEIFGQLRGMMGDEGAMALQGMLESVNRPEAGIIGTITGVALLLVGATTVFGELQDSLDRIFRAPEAEKGGGLWSLIRTRLLSFGMILGIGFLLIVSLVLSAALAALAKWWSPIFGDWTILARVFNLLVSFGLFTLAFAMIYKFMPRVELAWRDVWIGAIVTSIMFAIGKYLIGLYIGRAGVSSGFGAAGSLAVVMVWVYYSGQIFLLGAEFTRLYALGHGSRRNVREEEGGRGTAPAAA